MLDITKIIDKHKKIGIVDCNNFYVSCERAFNPESLGKPTVVLSNNDGCVIARSQEAKDLGIKMGEVFFKKKDFMHNHNFHIYSSNYNLYGDMSERVMNIIQNHIKDIEVYSIDECFIDLSNIPLQNLMHTLFEIKNDVFNNLGIPVSIGAGPNKTLAKLTSTIAKKKENFSGVCSYWEDTTVPTKIYNLDVTSIWGIGYKWGRKLKDIGISKINQFVSLDDSILRQITNISGVKSKHELLGLYCYHLSTTENQKKHIASTRSFGSDVNNFNEIAAAMHEYIRLGVKKLENNKVLTKSCTIFLAGNKAKSETHCYTTKLNFNQETRNLELIWSSVYPKLKQIYNKNKNYKKCGIIFSNLTSDKAIQLSLFDTPINIVKPPTTQFKNWHMRRDYLTQKYTSSWDEIPAVF